MKFIFATNNRHKLDEVRFILKNVEILSLEDMGINTEIPEDFYTLHENAMQKAKYIHQLTGMNVFADDTGFEIEALDGRPGVFSARYAGEGCTFEDNVKKVLSEMQGIKDRRASFRTVVALIIDDCEHLFEGSVNGSIIDESMGREGFGYDPIFIPVGFDLTFAQMPSELKNSMSHRARAFEKLAAFLETNQQAKSMK